jgi:hypothetical protein
MQTKVRNVWSTVPLPGFNQRWREHRSLYRPAGEVIRPSEYEVELLPEAEAKSFCLLHHYAHSYPVSVARFGLYRRGALVGVTIFSVPVNYDAYTEVFQQPQGGLLAEAFSRIGYSPKNCVDLGRLVLLDEAPGNSESYFVARCFEVLRARGVQGVISFSDPVPRRTLAGELVHPGHCGSVYQSLSAVYIRRATPRTLRLLPDATVLSPRTLQKIRAAEKGWLAGASALQMFGADAPPAEPEARIHWLNYWLPQLTRPLRHPGNFKYAFALDRRLRRFMPKSRPYPKLIAAPPHDAALAA